MGLLKKIGLAIVILIIFFIIVGAASYVLLPESTTSPTLPSTMVTVTATVTVTVTPSPSPIPTSTTTVTVTTTPTSTPKSTIDNKVVVGNIAYLVESVKTVHTVGESSFEVEAEGVFVLVTLTMENLGKKTETITADIVKIQDDEGNLYEGSNRAWILIEENLFLRQLQPGLPTTGIAVFDVPEDVGRIHLRVSGGLFSAEYELIDLGSI